NSAQREAFPQRLHATIQQLACRLLAGAAELTDLAQTEALQMQGYGLAPTLRQLGHAGDDAIEIRQRTGVSLRARAGLHECRITLAAIARQRVDGPRVRRPDRIDHGGQHPSLYKRRMKGRIPVTLQRFPEPDPDLLLDIRRINAVLADAVAVD